MGYVCTLELSESCLNKQSGVFSVLIFLMKDRSDAFSLSSTFSQKSRSCMFFTFVLDVHLRASLAALFCTR